MADVHHAAARDDEAPAHNIPSNATGAPPSRESLAAWLLSDAAQALHAKNETAAAVMAQACAWLSGYTEAGDSHPMDLSRAVGRLHEALALLSAPLRGMARKGTAGEERFRLLRATQTALCLLEGADEAATSSSPLEVLA